MAIQDNDLFLVRQQSGGSYEDKKVRWSTLRTALGAKLAVQTNVDGTGGEPGYMYPDRSFEYDPATGMLSVNLDTTGIHFKGVINEGNKDGLPETDCETGDFYICDEDGTVISTAKWPGIDPAAAIIVDPAQQVPTGGDGYRPNNGTVVASAIIAGDGASFAMGAIDVEIVGGEVSTVVHNPGGAGIDLSAAQSYVGQVFSFDFGGGADSDTEAYVVLDSIGNDGTDDIAFFKVNDRGRGYVLNGVAGAGTEYLAISDTDPTHKGFPIEVSINDVGSVTAITSISYSYGFEDGDTFKIVPTDNKVPTTYATFNIAIQNTQEVTLNLNDKLILGRDGEWILLSDTLAAQAVLDVVNEENAGTNLTPALVITNKDGDIRYKQIRIEDVDSNNSGLMPPDLYDRVVNLPEILAGGTVVDILIPEDLSVDGGSEEEYNPLNAADETRYDDNNDPIDEGLAKDIKLTIDYTKEVSSKRAKGVVVIANADEIRDKIQNGYQNATTQYHFVLNADLASDHFVPRDFDLLDAKTESVKTIKRLNLETDKDQILPTTTATLTSSLTFRDGTEDAETNTYEYFWEAVSHINGVVVPIADTTPTITFSGANLDGPYNVTCQVTEKDTDGNEVQVLSKSLTINVSSPVPTPPPTPPTIGSVSIVGPSPVYVGDSETYTIQVQGGTTTNNEVTGTVDSNFATNVGNVLTFHTEGDCLLTATVSNELVETPETTSRIIEVLPVVVNPPNPTDIGDVSIVGPDEVYLGSPHTYTIQVTNGTSDDNKYALSAANGVADISTTNDETKFEVTFTQLGDQQLLSALVTSEKSDPKEKDASKEVKVIEYVPPPVLGDVTIVGPSSTLAGTKQYTYDYTGTATINSETWSIVDVNGDENMFSIDQDGNLTADEAGVVTIKIELNTSEGDVEDTKVINVAAPPTTDQIWDNNPNERFRLHLIVTKDGLFGYTPSTLPANSAYKSYESPYEIYDMKANNGAGKWLNDPSPGYPEPDFQSLRKDTFVAGGEYMLIFIRPGGKIVNLPAASFSTCEFDIGPKSFTTPESNFNNLFTNARCGDATLMDLSNAKTTNYMFKTTEVLPNFEIDFTGAQIESAVEMFSYISSTNKVHGSWKIWDTMDMSKCTTVNKMFLRSTLSPSHGDVVMDWDLSECTNFREMLARSTGHDNAQIKFGPKTPPTVSKALNFIEFAYNSNKFRQNISDWCVSSVVSGDKTKDAFTSSGRNASLNPVWGTCPGNSF